MGIVNYLRTKGASWLGSRFSRGTMAEHELEREKVRATYGGGIKGLRLLPWIDAQTAETGEMRAAYRQMFRDPTVKAAIYSKVFAVAALDLTVKPAGTGPLAKKGAAWVRYAMEKCAGGIPGIVNSILAPGLQQGNSLCEKVWHHIERGEFNGNYGLKALKSKDPDIFRLEIDEFMAVQRVTSLIRGMNDTFSPEAFVLWQHMPLYENPLGQSDLRAAYRAFWIIDSAWKFRAIRLQKFGNPMLWGKYKNDSQKAELDEALRQAAAQTFVSTPDTVMVEVMQLAQSGNDIFRDAIVDLRHEVMLGITGAILQALEGAKTGARSIGEVHQSSAELLVWYLASSVAECLNRQLVPDLIDLNYSGMEYPEIQLSGANDMDLLPSMQIDQFLLQSGQKLSKQEAQKRYRRSPPDGPDDVWSWPGGSAGAAGMGTSTAIAPGGTGAMNGLQMPFCDTDQEVPARRPFGEASGDDDIEKFCRVGEVKPGPCPGPEKPDESTTKETRRAPGSQLHESVKTKLRDFGMVGTFPPADVPMANIRMADLSRGAEALKHEPLMQWDQKTKSGRISRQYRYTQEFHDRNAEAKFARVEAISPHIDKIGKELTSRMTNSKLPQRDRDAAAIANVIRETGLRPTDGADSVKHGHFGIASLQARHVKVVGDEVRLDFIGKEGVRNKTVVRDPANVAFLKNAIAGKGPKDSVWSAGSDHAGDALKDAAVAVGAPGNVKLKDLRTLKAAQTASSVVKSYPGPPPPLTGNKAKDAKAINKAINDMSGKVASVLNNTPAQARANYIPPRIFATWQKQLLAS